MDAEEKEKLKRQKLKEKRKLLRSGKHICKDCGYIGKAKKKQVGSWIFFFIKLIIASPFIAVIIALSLIEGMLRGLSFSSPQSAIWDAGFEKFFPNLPYKLFGCVECKNETGMVKINTHEGKNVFERFDRDRFITR